MTPCGLVIVTVSENRLKVHTSQPKTIMDTFIAARTIISDTLDELCNRRTSLINKIRGMEL